MHILRRRLLRRFVLDTLESRKFEVSVRTWQRQMPMGCVQERMPLLPLVSVPLLWRTTYDAIKVGVVHIGVGLCVVVLLVWAMRGPQCVEQQRAGFPRFFRMCPELCRLKINRCLRGRHGHEAAG